jgi:protein glucosyltransferase
MAEVKTPWHKKDPRVVWRGKIKMAELRKELVRVSDGKSWSDIKPVVINDAKDSHTKDVMNLRQFCGYVLYYPPFQPHHIQLLTHIPP